MQAKNVCVIKEDICFVDQRRQIWASGRGGQRETEPLLRDGPDTAHSHTSSPSQAKFNKLHFGPRLPKKPCNAIQDQGLPSPWVVQWAGLSACPWPASRAREGEATISGAWYQEVPRLSIFPSNTPTFPAGWKQAR